MIALERLWRRLLMLVGRGEITLVDDTKVAQIVQVAMGPLVTRDNTVRLAEYGYVSNPPDGTDCVVIFIGGDTDNGVVIATNKKEARLKNLQRGEVAIHDDQNRWIWIKRNSIEIEAGGKTVEIKNADVVNITASSKVELTTPQLKVNGDILCTGTVTGQTNVVAGTKQMKTHIHSGVTTGGGNTGQPV